MPALDKKGTPKTTRKILERIGRCAKKQRVRADYSMKSLPMPTKTTPSALNGSVNPSQQKDHTVASTAENHYPGLVRRAN